MLHSILVRLTLHVPFVKKRPVQCRLLLRLQLAERPEDEVLSSAKIGYPLSASRRQPASASAVSKALLAARSSSKSCTNLASSNQGRTLYRRISTAVVMATLTPSHPDFGKFFSIQK